MAEQNGWIAIHRCLTEKAIWQCSSPEQKVIMITLLMMANHRKKQWLWKGEKFDVKPGQFVTSIESIKKRAGKGISSKNIRSALSKFEKLEFLANKSAKTGRLITIVNWDKYQVEKELGGKDNGKQVADEGQTGGRQVASNKNDKNVKNDNKKDYSENVKLTDAEYEKLINEWGKQGTTRLIAILDNYKGSTGKKYKSDYKTILNWVTERYLKEGGTRLKKPEQQTHEPEMSEAERIELEEVNKKIREAGLIND